MFTRPLNQCFSLKRRLFCENQPIFVGRLPIEIFYFGNFQWSFFGKSSGQKSCFENAFVWFRLTSFHTKLGSRCHVLVGTPDSFVRSKNYKMNRREKSSHRLLRKKEAYQTV